MDDIESLIPKGVLKVSRDVLVVSYGASKDDFQEKRARFTGQKVNKMHNVQAISTNGVPAGRTFASVNDWAKHAMNSLRAVYHKKARQSFCAFRTVHVDRGGGQLPLPSLAYLRNPNLSGREQGDFLEFFGGPSGGPFPAAAAAPDQESDEEMPEDEDDAEARALLLRAVLCLPHRCFLDRVWWCARCLFCSSSPPGGCGCCLTTICLLQEEEEAGEDLGEDDNRAAAAQQQQPARRRCP